MSFVRDKDARTRGIGAVAALDGVSDANRRVQRARAIAMVRRDARLARVAMGALSTGYRQDAPTSISSKLTFDTGRAPAPTSPTFGRGASAPTTPTTPIWQQLLPTAQRVANTFTQATQSLEPIRPTAPSPPPPLPPPPVEVVDTATRPPPKPSLPPASSSTGGSGGGIVPPVPRAPLVEAQELPDVIDTPTSTSSSSPISGKTLAIGAALLLGAYYLSKKKA